MNNNYFDYDKLAKRTHLLNQTLNMKLYQAFEELLFPIFNPFFGVKNGISDIFILAIQKEDVKAIDILFNCFKKNFTPSFSDINPEFYAPILIKTDNKEVYQTLKKHGFLELFKNHITLDICFENLSSTSLDIVLNEFNQPLDDKKLNSLIYNLIAKNKLGSEIINYSPDAKKFKNFLKVISDYDFEKFETNVGFSMFQAVIKKDISVFPENFENNSTSDYLYALLEAGINPYKKIKDYNLKKASLNFGSVLNSRIKPQMYEMNYFDSLLTDENKASLEAKWLEVHMQESHNAHKKLKI